MANGYALSNTVSPTMKSLESWWSSFRSVDLPRGASIVSPSRAAITLSVSSEPAFLIASARKYTPSYPSAAQALG